MFTQLNKARVRSGSGQKKGQYPTGDHASLLRYGYLPMQQSRIGFRCCMSMVLAFLRQQIIYLFCTSRSPMMGAGRMEGGRECGERGGTRKLHSFDLPFFLIYNWSKKPFCLCWYEKPQPFFFLYKKFLLFMPPVPGYCVPACWVNSAIVSLPPVSFATATVAA